MEVWFSTWLATFGGKWMLQHCMEESTYCMRTGQIWRENSRFVTGVLRHLLVGTWQSGKEDWGLLYALSFALFRKTSKKTTCYEGFLNLRSSAILFLHLWFQHLPCPSAGNIGNRCGCNSSNGGVVFNMVGNFWGKLDVAASEYIYIYRKQNCRRHSVSMHTGYCRCGNSAVGSLEGCCAIYWQVPANLEKKPEDYCMLSALGCFQTNIKNQHVMNVFLNLRSSAIFVSSTVVPTSSLPLCRTHRQQVRLQQLQWRCGF